MTGFYFRTSNAKNCLDGGFLLGQMDQAKLEAFIRKHWTKETKKG